MAEEKQDPVEKKSEKSETPPAASAAPKSEAAPKARGGQKNQAPAADAPAGAGGGEAGAEGEAPKAAAVRRKAKNLKHIPMGIAHITSSFNNTQVTITDMKGEVVSWSSAGRAGFKGSRRSTAYAATVVAQEAGKAAMAHGMQELEVRVQGPGAGRESAIRALQSVGFTINAIKDVTPIPHNGCRPPKRRRV